MSYVWLRVVELLISFTVYLTLTIAMEINVKISHLAKVQHISQSIIHYIYDIDKFSFFCNNTHEQFSFFLCKNT